ncbi:MBL fold metallo-hydrolase [Microlunatus sp. Gsoil 973]|uniref:MBL fold metallo-hydrolase n=1 Tax=Microlunatus sp. Gsoil 973 TaxID=2672569 RepID=UPI0012B4CBCC|nr:MBL fold metallo-hydrolase [Microlunatus sp. Gsoil 973]QGN31539.1 MBL fold metallo-hydrolase [Microlunatus sp. Gsoil 973]
MELTVIGCSGSISGPLSPASSYLVTAPHGGRSFSLLVDLGPGSLGALYGLIDPSRIDAIAISHLHPDHCIDLCGFHVASRYAPNAPWDPVDLYGPPGTLERIRRAYDPSLDNSDAEDLTASFTPHAWQPSQQVGPFLITTAMMSHPVPTYGMRIEAGGEVLAYSADTGPTQALVDLARGADLLLAEASFLDGEANPSGLHLTGSQTGDHAQAAGVSALVITHVPPWYDTEQVLTAAREHFDGPVEAARPGMIRRVGGTERVGVAGGD